ncbi:MAG: MBOAT family O-acyltransferase [Verrucomicrobiota bacterium]
MAIVLPLYYRLQHRGQNWMLLAASYVFYGWWDARFLALLIGSSVFDFYCGIWIESVSEPKQKKWLLAGSIMVNMGILCAFKYFNFFAESLQLLLAKFGHQASFPTLHIILPLGISFYTFLSMSYTIDVYRGEMKATRNPIDYLLFVAFFPHLVAGPIVRASYLLPQCARPRTIKSTAVINGFWLILLGYFKKVVIGDRLAQVADWGFSQPFPPFSDANAWLIVYAFAFQIYADFSGYSDIARGLAKLMGFELVENFKAPYLVSNPPAFWRNWHISLSTWLRDYLYIPMGGNRCRPPRIYFNLLVTMVLGGLWHGAGAAYILWGFYHGALLIVHRLWNQMFRKKIEPADPPDLIPGIKTGRIIRIVLFFHVTCIGWLFFRAGASPANFDQISVVKGYLRSMATTPHRINALAVGVLLLCGVGFALQWKNDLMMKFYLWPVRWQAASVVATLLAIAGLGVFEGAQFIYFQF